MHFYMQKFYKSMAKKSVAHIVFLRTFGFVIFLIVLGISNYLVKYAAISSYNEAVFFFNSNILLLFIITFTGMLSEIFWTLIFPFNLIAPIVSAVSSIFIVTFVYRIWNFIEEYAKTGFSFPLNKIYFLVFLLVLIIGYIVVLVKFLGHKKELKEEKIKKREKSEKIEWGEIGNEFKLLFYNIGRGINKLFEREKKKK